MAEPTNTSTPRYGIIGFFQDLWDLFLGAGDFVDTALIKMQNLTETNYLLGVKMMNMGNTMDAIFRFRVALWFNGNHIPSLYQLGRCFMDRNMMNDAIVCFQKVLRLDAAHPEALFTLTSIRPDMVPVDKHPRTMPLSLLQNIFDRLAKAYNEIQNNKGYRAPAQMHQLLGVELDRREMIPDLLDLGCGTGLSGQPFQGMVHTMVGVDISNEMLTRASRLTDERGIRLYNQVIQKDMRAYLQEAKPESVSVTLALDVFQYVGDLQPVFGGVARVLKQGGLFGFTFEPFTAKTGYGLMLATRQFGHSLAYVQAIAEQAGFDQVRVGEVLVYPKHAMQMCIFRKR